MTYVQAVLGGLFLGILIVCIVNISTEIEYVRKRKKRDEEHLQQHNLK